MTWKRILLLLVACTAVLTAAAQRNAQIDKQKKLIATLERQIAAQEREIAKIKKGRSATEERVKRLARQIDTRTQLLEAQEHEARLLAGELTRTDRTADSLGRTRHLEVSQRIVVGRQKRLGRALDRQKELYAEMVREAYRNYRHENYLTYLFASEDFADIARKIANLRQVASMRADKLRRIGDLKVEVAREKEELDRRKHALDSVTAQLRAQRAKLEHDARNAKAEVRRMSKQEKQRLQQKIAREQQLSVAVEELRKLSRGNKEGGSFSSKTSGLRLPVAGGRVRRYMENMAEITGPKGARVTSIYEGKVVEIKRNRITNKYDVYVAHGEYLTTYANLGSVAVQKGQKVAKNAALGTIGSSVNVTTMETEYKLVFGIYSPSPTEKMRAENCFRK